MHTRQIGLERDESRQVSLPRKRYSKWMKHQWKLYSTGAAILKVVPLRPWKRVMGQHQQQHQTISTIVTGWPGLFASWGTCRVQFTGKTAICVKGKEIASRQGSWRMFVGLTADFVLRLCNNSVWSLSIVGCSVQIVQRVSRFDETGFDPMFPVIVNDEVRWPQGCSSRIIILVNQVLS